MNTNELLLSPAFLFRFAATCVHRKTLRPHALKLSKDYALPCFGELEGQRTFADLRAAWNPRGLAFELSVTGKKQLPWCRDSKPEDSDGLQLWIDTRDAHNIHRATRFCHHFVFLPEGSGSDFRDPTARLMPIHRARANPQPVDPELLVVRSQRQRTGYRLTAFLPADCLTGFAPEEQPRLGFFYAVADRELGCQTFGVGPEFPVAEDPSLWGTLELVAA
jgi:hypothetical protein